MEDDNGLDLTLSLPCGGPPSGSKGKTTSGSEVRVEEAERSTKLIDEFKNFLDGSNHKEESTMGSQRSTQSKPDENLFYDLSKNTPTVDASSSGGFWGGKNESKSSEPVDERRHDTTNKRKNMFDELNLNHQKRNERESAFISGLHKSRTQPPHVSITTDEGSMAENEDVADSEADGSTSKRQSDCSKEARESNVDLQSQRRPFTISSEKDYNKVGHVSHGVPFSGQSANILNMPYPLSVKESNSGPVMSSSSQQPVIPANLPLMFNYSSVQVPAVEAGKSEGFISYFGRGPPNTNKQNDGLKITQGATSANAAKQFERGAQGDGKHGKEEWPPMHTEGDTEGINGNDHERVADGILTEFPAIRPGISAELKFGGSGSSPNLPWVSTTAPGPNGKTISGVTYKYTATQIRIVCACHGSHLSPDEFIQHATDQQPDGGGSGGGGGGGLSSFPNPAASAQN